MKYHKRVRLLLASAVAVLLSFPAAFAAPAADPLFRNGDFSDGLTAWEKFGGARVFAAERGSRSSLATRKHRPPRPIMIISISVSTLAADRKSTDLFPLSHPGRP